MLTPHDARASRSRATRSRRLVCSRALRGRYERQEALASAQAEAEVALAKTLDEARAAGQRKLEAARQVEERAVVAERHPAYYRELVAEVLYLRKQLGERPRSHALVPTGGMRMACG